MVAVNEQGVNYEADTRHVELIAHSLRITEANAVATPGVKDPDPDCSSQKTNEPEIAATLSNASMSSAVHVEADPALIEDLIQSPTPSISK